MKSLAALVTLATLLVVPGANAVAVWGQCTFLSSYEVRTSLTLFRRRRMCLIDMSTTLAY